MNSGIKGFVAKALPVASKVLPIVAAGLGFICDAMAKKQQEETIKTEIRKAVAEALKKD